MSEARDHVTKESYELVTSGSFAMNVANFRSLLLSYEKELQTSNPDAKRAALILKEIAMLREIILDQMQAAGSNARALGVPPEELAQVLTIYQRALGLAAIAFASKYAFLFDTVLDSYLKYVEKWADAPDLHKTFAGQLSMVRLSINQIFSSPDSASLVVTSMLGLIERLLAMWPAVSASIPPGVVLGSGGPPVKPPSEPPSPNGGDKGSGGSLEQRVGKLEVLIDRFQKDISEISTDLKDMRKDVKSDFNTVRGEMRTDFTAVKGEMRTDFRLLFGAIITVALGLAGLVAKGFHWF